MGTDSFSERFDLGALIGRGGMSEVHRGVERASGAEVAIKRIRGKSDEARERFDREIAVLSALSHPRVVRFLDHGYTKDEERYLVMEWIEGPTLAEQLRGDGLDLRGAVALIRGVLEGLARVHESGIVHRDLKPSNLLLRRGDPGSVVIVDFGIARAEDDEPLTRMGEVVGTWAYMSPEQARGRISVDGRSDLFSLGCISYEMLTGTRAFGGRGSTAILAKILTEDPLPAHELRREIPEALGALTMRLLAKKVVDRPADAAEAIAQLDDLGELPMLGPPAPSKPGTPRVASLLPKPETAATAPPRGGRRPSGRPRAVISSVEQRLACLGAFVPATRVDVSTQDRWSTEVRREGVQLSWMANGAALVAVVGGAFDRDDTIRILDQIRSLGAQSPGARAANAWGPITLTNPPEPQGTVRDRLDALLEGTAPGEVRVDRSVRALLKDHIAIEEDERGFILRAGRPAEDSTDTFVGRRVELATLTSMMGVAIDEGRVQCALVIGGAGLGKTWLARELIRQLSASVEGLRVARAAPRSRRAAPFSVVRQILSQAAPSRARDRALAMIDRLAESIPDRGQARLGDDVREAWNKFIRVVVPAPMLIVLDDLQWADEPSLELISSGFSVGADQPVMIVCLARPELDRERLSFGDIQPYEIALRALSEKQARQLVDRVAIGIGLDDRETVIGRGQGVPLYLSQLAVAARDGGATSLPDTLLGVIQARLERCTRLERRVLRTASLFGDPFPRDGVEALVDHGPLEAVFASLAQKRFLTESAPREDEGWSSFAHGLLRDAMYETLTDADRALGHRAVAEWLEERSDIDPERLATHWDEAGEPERAALALKSAAARALAAHDMGAALRLAAAAIERLAEGHGARTELFRTQAEASIWRGNVNDAAQHAWKALELAEEGTIAWFEAAGAAALATSRGATMIDAAELAERVARAPVQEGAETARLVCRGRVAVGEIHGGRSAVRLSEVAAECRAYLDVNEKADWVSGWSHEILAFDHHVERRVWMAQLEQRRAYEVWVDAGMSRQRAFAGVNLGHYLARLGKLDEAEAVLNEQRETAEVLSLGMVLYVARENLAFVALCRGELERAWREAEEVRRLAIADGLTRTAAGAAIYMAQIALAGGHATRALELAREAFNTLESGASLAPEALAVAARAHVALGEAESGLAVVDHAQRLADAIRIDSGHALLSLARVEAYAAAARMSDAEREVHGTLADLEACLAGAPPEVHASFFTHVPEHRALQEWSHRLDPTSA
ncbi:MAG: protein kinase [Sandaracinaceae bacterium]